MPTLAIIVATANNNVIGKGNDIPWYCPADLQYFKRTTLGAPVLMGRKTWESLKIHPLPGRKNIIITRDPDFTAEGAEIVHSITQGLAQVADSDKVFIIGGATIYEQLIDAVDELFITQVDADISGDRYFPQINQQDWLLDSAQAYPADEKNPYDMVFTHYSRVQSSGLNADSPD
ncbi:MAG: dihydrofolate reductase [Candidatus Thioglobus sp.]|nr:MAG: dihydrofolate reductase [Candidatus Thioglobus sp.]|tara:strand:+ start:361 stop:885 length:525 start_codon:yes stop_codon:yes gene_type:complete